MKFEMLDKKMRAFEQNLDQLVLPEVFIVVRLDGRGFTKLTKEALTLDRPFDARFRNAMIETVKRLMDCGFKITYGYTESDEISLLFDRDENVFGRKARKLISILAGEASASFTQAIGSIGVFDCRIIPLPNSDLVVDYFRWRCEDANRNALSAWCYWKLREKGLTSSAATQELNGKSIGEKNELLFQFGINYNDLPAWQKRGIGFYYEDVEKLSLNPTNGDQIKVIRRQLTTNLTLPVKSDYDTMLKELLRV